jgi:hypothetical protein
MANNIPILSLSLLSNTTDEVDTFEITEIYMSRPTNVAHFGLGLWFCRAMGFDDMELIHSNTRTAKQILLDKRYTFLPDVLVKLVEYNHSLEN